METVNQTRAPRSYGQFCALARSLDVVGDRWTLLIVRELLPGPLRYTELKTSLDGIATNLLAARLRTLEEHGIVARRLEESGVAYGLTPWGAELREPMEALGRWGAPLLATGRGDDAFQPRWLTLALPALLRGATADPPVELGIETDGFRMVLRVDQDGPRAFVRPEAEPETWLVAEPDVIVALAAGELTVSQALAQAEVRGPRRVIRSVFASGR
ncbi:winged helix-turn-helix transcriptional regulator [Microlunatus parietis]|uniref:DNA-binding HxlR family transcriptional regulator n=1 Tax=Microlunatus parietis TaxID=682979 RepID=A0A7Y9I5X6_9ACTN|nr:helix-turn-helix domain-containing protein [Microlunatus parietis]NYE70878.1 DNA-binding HxlR family transcriptional regulator [Microlunatus parietis]